MLRSILIANRGEIAVRIIRTCREMGIRTIALYSDADADALHVYLADEAIPLGPAPAAESYLNFSKILAAAQESGADAIHPGYGFLSENADFAQAVADAGLRFIGPPVSAMRVMGSKTDARAAMEQVGVPVVPGYQAGQALGDLLGAAAEIGYPVLVKAAAGGGGKGMRIVAGPEVLPEAVESARREAQAAFGDDRLFLEKYIPAPRHVEFQIFGDSHGNLIHLGERECSIQRRHQKIVEETPSPALHPELRARMGRAAVMAARAVDYTGAGTVEFLLDQNENFYFLEMNTRLQVEHPITELVTGLDLVRWQIRVADGARLPLRQEEVRFQGHAIECRIYAEDSANGFLPAIGTILRLHEPSGPGIRVDSGVRAGDEISRFYDPLIAKVSVHAENRAAAVNRMDRALRELVILGDLLTNAAFLRDVMAHPVFQAGETDTGFIDEHFSDWQPFGSPAPHAALIAAALAQMPQQARPVAPGDEDLRSPWQQLLDFRA